MDATVAWVWPADTRDTSDPSQGSKRALEAWARARGVRLSPPGNERTPAIPVDLALADRVEEELVRAHDAVSALDGEGASRALVRGEGILRAHPELPQAAWLMAEVLRGWAAVWTRTEPRDPVRAAAAWSRAAGLDDGRVAGLGEQAMATAAPAVDLSVAIDGDGAITLDGERVSPGPLRRAAGEHELTVTRDGVVVWAGWVGVGTGTVLALALPRAAPCSREDLARATFAGGEVRADGVRCPSWVAATPAARGADAVRVASCDGSRCGAFVEWSAGANNATSPPVAPGERHGGWPAWATWALVGAGAAAVATVTLAASGAFRAAPTETRFVSGGVKVNARVE